MTNTFDVSDIERTELRPFGQLLTAGAPDSVLSDLPIDELVAATVGSKVLVLRGFGMLEKSALERYCAAAGEILQWNFGAVLDLDVRPDPANYLFDKGDVPYHWDGAFAAAVPRIFLFQCVAGTVGGGETVFCDATAVYRDAPGELRELWSRVTVTYRTDKLAHYGGLVSWPLVSAHPETGAPTLRYAEPLDPAHYLNPLFLTVEGVSPEDAVRVMDDLRTRLYDPRYCYPHEWRAGDIVLADNHALLHGRTRFHADTARRLQRIQIL